MGDALIHFKLNLKTGFFKSEPYILTITDESLTFVQSRKKSRNVINIIPCANVKSIAIFAGSPMELEIRTEKEAFIGTLQEPVDLYGVIASLEAVFGKKFSHVYNCHIFFIL